MLAVDTRTGRVVRVVVQQYQPSLKSYIIRTANGTRESVAAIHIKML
jgi:hypothetical protein